METGNVGDQRIIDDLRRLVSQNPKNTAAVRTLARAQVRAGKADDAVATLRQGIAADAAGDREQLSLQLQLAQTYADVKLGQLQQAEHYLNEAVRRIPASATMQEHLGDLLHRLGKTEQSRAAWLKALTFSSAETYKSRPQNQV
ncbi:MAG: tetratricopeptide repeat protein [Pyrinomonadaceae bacterium]